MKIFRPILQICKKKLMAFSRKQRNAIPVIVKQIAAINRRKPDYSGYFGTPEGIRTPDTRLRRAVLCPAELLARIQFLFVSVTPVVENPPNVRRRTLYPGEVRGHIQKIFHYEGLQGSNCSIVRRRPLYPTEPRGYTGIRPMVQADRYRTILSGSGLSVNGGNDRSGPGGVSAARSEVRFPPASKNRARVGAGSPVPHCGSVGDDLGGPLHHRSRAVADVDDRVRP